MRTQYDPNLMEDRAIAQIDNGWYEEPFRIVDRRDIEDQPQH